jgi:hypothetical protein
MEAMRSPLLVVSAIVLTLLAVSCGSDDAGESPSRSGPPSAGPEVRAYLALCSVQSAAAASDVPTAEATFRDEVHETLHHLADEVGTVDRTVAAALLQAKSTVEADLAEDAPNPATLATHAQELLEAMEDAMGAVGLEAPGCLEQAQ